MKRRIIAFIVLWISIGAIPYIWASEKSSIRQELYFFDVGQGDSQLIVFHTANGQVARILIDAGPPSEVATNALDDAVPFGKKRIDLAIISHPDSDHYGGFRDIMRRYEIGSMLFTGRQADNVTWKALLKMVDEQSIPLIALGAGDKITFGESALSIRAPDRAHVYARDDNDSSLVIEVKGEKLRTLLTADISADVERALMEKGGISSHILKIPHHGSRFSSSEEFIRAVSPNIAIIQVGKNSHGHPSEEVLDRLQRRGIPLYRTDKNGTVRIIETDKGVRIYTERTR